jgi:hypothetical protein
MASGKQVFILLTSLLISACSPNSALISVAPSTRLSNELPLSSETELNTTPHHPTFELGKTQAQSLIQKVQEKTLGAQGCSAWAEFKEALTNGIKTIQPPIGLQPDSFADFVHGEYEALSNGLKLIEENCGIFESLSGETLGAIRGEFLCQAASVSFDSIALIQYQPLISGSPPLNETESSACKAKIKSALDRCSPNTFQQPHLSGQWTQACQ